MTELSTLNNEKYTVDFCSSERGDYVEIEGQVYLRSGIDKVIAALMRIKPHLPEEASND